MKLLSLVYRSWYYFRIGYGTYLVFLLGYASTLVTVYYLAVRNIPELASFFPKFAVFGVVATFIGVPVSVLTGWLHLKRSPLWRSELDISVEANPYNYRLPPGYWLEAFTPLYMELLTLLRSLAEKEQLLTRDDKLRLDQLKARLRILVEGGYVGKPRRRLDF